MKPPTLHADLTGLLAYFRDNRTPMGVARVQMALLEAADDLFAPMAFSARQSGFRSLPAAMLRPLLASARAGGRFDDAEWLALQDSMATALDTAPPPRFAAGDRVLALGPPGAEALRRFGALRAAHGVLVCALFYDAIPLVVPEHCEPELTARFAEEFTALCLQLDRVVAISAHAAAEFRAYQRQVLPAFDIPVGVMPLDAPFAASPGPPPFDLAAPYVLCVATLEARKNHVALLQAWRSLLRRHGPARMPDLVLVGREGFGAEAALRLLHQVPELRGKLRWLRGLGDAALAALYRGCLFSVFPSHHEGWGLPVTEALSHGKLVVVPDHTSLREAGGTAAIYVAPDNAEALAEACWSLIADPGHRATLEAALRPPLRSWREVAAGLAEELRRDMPALPAALARQPFPTGWRISLAAPLAPPLPDLPSPAALLGRMIREGEAWAAPEAAGTWLLDGSAAFCLPLTGDMAAPLLVLEAAAPPAAVTLRLRAHPPGDPPGPWHEAILAAGEARVLELPLPPCGAGILRLELAGMGGFRPDHGGPAMLVLLSGLMLCEADNETARLRHARAQLGVQEMQPQMEIPGKYALSKVAPNGRQA